MSIHATPKAHDNIMRPILPAVMLLAAALRISAAPLPQAHPYQEKLRGYLATLKEKDFDVALKPVKAVASAWKNSDELARYWIRFQDPAMYSVKSDGLRVASKHFTLVAIEAGDTVNMGGGRNAFNAKDIAWWAQWDYPGNPYRGSKAVMRRAFVAAAVDMMMQDDELDRRKNRRSDYVGGAMIRWGYTWYVVKDTLPPNVQEAYEQGLVRMFELLENLTPSGAGGSDMEFFQLVGMWYAAQALGGDFPARALKRAHVVIERVTSETGYEKHGGAFDISYQGIALRFLAWAAMLYDDPVVSESLHKMLVLKSHLTLPEPDGTLNGPTHFNTGTAAAAPQDQWAWPSRDLAMAMMDEEALYTIWTRPELPDRLPDKTTMRKKVSKEIVKLVPATPLDTAPEPWKHQHWNMTINYAHDLYRQGAFTRWVALEKARSPLMRPPIDRGKDFITDLNGGGEFLVARIGDVGAIIHTGTIAEKWAKGVSGKSGGGLSAVWMPGRGTVVLGRCRATQGATPDEWTDANGRGPYTWPVHAVTGRGANGHYFSTARLRAVRSRQKVTGATEAVGIITAYLAASASADPRNELKGTVEYRREFRVNRDGVAFKSQLTSDGTDKIAELWEMIPLHMGYPDRREPAPTTVKCRTRGRWKPLEGEPLVADRVRLTRYGRHAYIVFKEPHTIKLGPKLNPAEFWRESVRNLMIDALGDDGTPQALVYKFTARP